MPLAFPDMTSRSSPRRAHSPQSPDAAARRTPTQQRSRQTVDTLFEAATHILETDGEQGLTTNRIAERAGYSIGTLYQYFPGKDAILLALMRRMRERTLDELDEVLERAVRGELSPRAAMEAYVHRLVEGFGRSRRALRLLCRIGWRIDSQPAIAAFHAEGTRRLHSAIVRLNSPVLPVPSEARLFVITRGILGSLRSAAQEDSPLLNDPAFERELVDLVWQRLTDPSASAD